MLWNHKNTRVYEFVIDEIEDIEATLIHFESFMCAATMAETSMPTLDALATKIGETESQADNSLRRMIDLLGQTPLLPATRQDLIDIATSCDKIANKCEHTSSMISCQHFLFPAEFKAEVLEIVSLTKKQFEVLKESISRLFGSFNELSKDHSILDEIRMYESKIDAIEVDLYKRIFLLPLGLAEQTQIASFVDLTCDVSDIIENIADKIQIMLIARKA